MAESTGKPTVRERIGRHAWVRSAALVGGGFVAGGILAGTLAAQAADDDGAAAPAASYEQVAGSGPGEGRGDGDGRHGHRHGGHGDGRHDEQPLTGEIADRVREAVLAEYPGATIRRLETDSDGVYEAHVTTADGTRVTVELDGSFAITGTETRRGDC